MRKWFLVVALVFTSLGVAAKGLDGDEYMLALNTNMSDWKTDNAEFGATTYDINFGYVRAKGLYLGVLYDTGKLKGYADQSYTNPGVSIGYVLNGWSLIASYIIGGTMKAADTQYKNGSGTQIDVAYLFKTGLPFFFGVGFTDQSITYKLQGSADLKFSTMYPIFKFVGFF
jgi:hypothetical protein